MRSVVRIHSPRPSSKSENRSSLASNGSGVIEKGDSTESPFSLIFEKPAQGVIIARSCERSTLVYYHRQGEGFRWRSACFPGADVFQSDGARAILQRLEGP